MSLSSCDIPSGGFREVRPCSAQLVETYGPDGKCFHQELIIHLLPSSVHPTMTGVFFNPLLSHGLGPGIKMSYPSKSSGAITSIYVDADNPRTFRCGIRAFYNQEKNMNASKAAANVEDTIAVLEGIKSKLEDNDGYDFDIESKLTTISDTADEVQDYIDDELDS